MSEQELHDILIQVQVSEGVNISVYYDHFVSTPTIPSIEPPFILYRHESTNTLKANGMVWDKDPNYIIDLCVINKNSSLEQQIEDLFDTYEIAYDKEEDFISNENMYQIRYFI